MTDEYIQVPDFLSTILSDVDSITPFADCTFICEIECEIDYEGCDTCQLCQLQCQQVCQTCQVVCEGGCQGTCQSSCQLDCQDACQDVCQSGQTAPPSTYGSMKHVSSTFSSITVNISAISGATSYTLVYRLTSQSGSWIDAITYTTTGDKTIPGLSANTSYTFNYYGGNSGGTGPYMPKALEASTTIYIAPPTAYGTMSHISSTVSSIVVSVSFISGATSYTMVCRLTNPPYTVIDTLKFTTTGNKTVSGLAANTSYTFNYYGENISGTGPYMPTGLVASTTSGRPSNWEWASVSSMAAGRAVQLSAREMNDFMQRVNEFRAYKGMGAYPGFTTLYTGNSITRVHTNNLISAVGAMNPPIAVPALVSTGTKVPIMASTYLALRNSLNSIQ